MKIWYAATEKFGPYCGDSWDGYIKWSKLFHLKELISLDPMLCGCIYEPDYGKAETYDRIMQDERSLALPFFNDRDYLYGNVKDQVGFNFLAVVKEPAEPCELINLDGFEFIGYDLLDYDFTASAITNCGGFDETFSSSELNEHGLIPTFGRAKEVQKNLSRNNPGEVHAECFLWALWRHITIGR